MRKSTAAFNQKVKSRTISVASHDVRRFTYRPQASEVPGTEINSLRIP
ncbi:hypothetical protein ACQCT3_01005 [Sutcliffiella horikoshii]